jgi:eukaryotic-like serine/threonine-protein kinase
VSRRSLADARRLLPYVTAAAGGFLLAYAIVFFFIFPAQLVPEELKVPNVLGLTYDDAVHKLNAAGLKAEQGESRFNVGSPKTTVLQETPAAGAPAARGSKVVLDVSAGERRTEVPNVVGLTQEQAQLTLEKVGLTMGDVTVHESPLPRGEVLASTPVAGTQAVLPSIITLVVSGGPQSINVPDLIGQPFAQAKAALEQLGLRTAVIQVDSASADPEGTIMSQSPAPGTPVEMGTGVSLTVAGRLP